MPLAFARQPSEFAQEQLTQQFMSATNGFRSSLLRGRPFHQTIK
jgi:hypothetical protein